MIRKAPENMMISKREAMMIGDIQVILQIVMMKGIEKDLLVGKRKEREETTNNLTNMREEEGAEVEAMKGDKKENTGKKNTIVQMIDTNRDANISKEMLEIVNTIKEDIESAMINTNVIIRIAKTNEETMVNMINMKKTDEEIMIIQINTRSQKKFKDTQNKAVDIQNKLIDTQKSLKDT